MRRRSKIINPDPANLGFPLPATGILLAGGKNSRMQRNKAFLELGGKPLVERSLEVLKATFAEVIISSNDPELYAAYKIRVVPDAEQGKGPLAGLAAGLQAASWDTAFFVACDMPFIQPGLMRYLWQWVDAYDAVVPTGLFGSHPLHAYYHRHCLVAIEKNLRAGHYKIIDFYPECQVKYVKEEDLVAFGDVAKILSNVNTPEEWQQIKNQE